MGMKADGVGGTERPCAWRLVSAPVDFCCGADRLLVHVRDVLGRELLDGSAYVFRNRRATRSRCWWWMRKGCGCRRDGGMKDGSSGRRWVRRCGRSAARSSGG